MINSASTPVLRPGLAELLILVLAGSALLCAEVKFLGLSHDLGFALTSGVGIASYVPVGIISVWSWSTCNRLRVHEVRWRIVVMAAGFAAIPGVCALLYSGFWMIGLVLYAIDRNVRFLSLPIWPLFGSVFVMPVVMLERRLRKLRSLPSSPTKVS